MSAMSGKQTLAVQTSSSTTRDITGRAVCSVWVTDDPANNREQPRSSMFLAAVLRAGAEQAPVKVRNMSQNGAMIDTPLSPPPGTKVELLRGSLRAQGTVMWTSNNRCGLRFSSDLAVAEWLASPPKAEQHRVDDIVALVKAGALPFDPTDHEPGTPPSDEAPKTHEQLAEYLGDVVRLLEDLEDDLASSEETLGRHADKLQNLDIAMQMVRAITQEITGEAATLAKLEDLKVVCAEALCIRTVEHRDPTNWNEDLNC